jgi:hypothetical protein
MSRALEFIHFLRAVAADARRLTGSELTEAWRGPSQPLDAESALLLAVAVEAANFSFEPDVRYSGHVLRPADRVVLFSPVASGKPSSGYLAAAAIARLGVIVASADGAVVPEERDVLRTRTLAAIDLAEDEQRRLSAYIEWLLDTPISLDAAEREAAELSADTKLRIGTFLVAVAQADRHISAPERWILAGSFALLGLTSSQLEKAITAAEPVTTKPAEDVIEELAQLLTTSIAPMAIDPRFIRADRLAQGALESNLGSDRPKTDIPGFEAELAARWSGVDPGSRKRAGSLLALVPSRERWQDFLRAWKSASLSYWLLHASECPHALAVLFGGFAFFEYDETSFWPQFKRDLWPMSEAQVADLRGAHERAIKALGLEMVRNASLDRMIVGSAVHHIGVPLSLWADFLAVADHTLRQPAWRSWSTEQWVADVSIRCGPRTRLLNFLKANETAARETIEELGQIRDYAMTDPATTIEDLADLAHVQFLRDEYFDEIPETAEFFRPDNLLSLFAGRYFLRYDDERDRIDVHLPRLDEPGNAVWRVGDCEQAARREPSWMAIDSAAFGRWVDVHLDASGTSRRTKRIAGIRDWGLYDQRREAFLELDLGRAPELRMGDYLLVSARAMTHMKRTGFLGQYPENQVVNLADGTRCFVTRLSPAAPDGSLQLRWATGDGELREGAVIFRTRLATGTRTIKIHGIERPMGDPSLPWFFLHPGPYPPINHADLPNVAYTKLSNTGSASAYVRLKRYAELGVVATRGDGAWRLDQERADVQRTGDIVEVWMLGRPTNMWALGNQTAPHSIEVIGKDGLTYLHGTWPASCEWDLRNRLAQHGVEVAS